MSVSLAETTVAPVSSPANSVLLNPVIKNLAALAVRAWAKRWIITFTAPTGVGKTTAVDYVDRTLEFPHRVLKCKQITTRYSLLQPLSLAPGEKWTTHGRNWMRASDLYDRAVESIRQKPYLLIVDEADRLRMDCFEILRDFWDDARLPMLLVGNEVLTEKINLQHERLFRRIRARHEQRPLREADLRKTLEFMGYAVSDEEFTLLWKTVGGSPGFAEALLEVANEIAASHGAKRGIQALESAVVYFPTLRQRIQEKRNATQPDRRRKMGC